MKSKFGALAGAGAALSAAVASAQPAPAPRANTVQTVVPINYLDVGLFLALVAAAVFAVCRSSGRN